MSAYESSFVSDWWACVAYAWGVEVAFMAVSASDVSSLAIVGCCSSFGWGMLWRLILRWRGRL